MKNVNLPIGSIVVLPAANGWIVQQDGGHQGCAITEHVFNTPKDVGTFVRDIAHEQVTNGKVSQPKT